MEAYGRRRPQNTSELCTDESCGAQGSRRRPRFMVAGTWSSSCFLAKRREVRSRQPPCAAHDRPLADAGAAGDHVRGRPERYLRGPRTAIFLGGGGDGLTVGAKVQTYPLPESRRAFR